MKIPCKPIINSRAARKQLLRDSKLASCGERHIAIINRASPKDLRAAADALDALDAGASPSQVELPANAILDPTLIQINQICESLGLEALTEVPKDGMSRVFMMAAARFSDPAKESVVVGSIVSGDLFARIPAHCLVEADAFSDPKWRLAYRIGLALREDSEGVCCLEAVNDFIAMHELDSEMQEAFDPSKSVPWRLWSQDVDLSMSFCESTRPLEYCLKEIDRLWRGRRAAELGTRLANGDIELEDARIEFEELLHGTNGLPALDSAERFCAEEDDTPPEVIEGIIHQGCKGELGGGSKTFKTWTLLQMSSCVSHGIPWIGCNTHAGEVLYINFELPRWSIRKRVQEICEALEVDYPRNLKLLNLRGYAADANVILPRIAKEIRQHPFVLIIIDPLYKILGGREENMSKDMADLMLAIEKLAVESSAAVFFGAHFSKGNQSLKEAMDRISGSGVLARDPDTIITMTQHEEKNAYTVDTILRNFPPLVPFVIQREHPLMLRADGLDPNKLKKPKTSQSVYGSTDLIEVLELNGGSLAYNQWRDRCQAKAGMSPGTFYNLFRKLRDAKEIFFSELDEKWGRRS